MADLILFGLKQFSQIAHYYITHDTNDKVVCLTIDDNFFDSEPFPEWTKGMDIIPLSQTLKMQGDDHKIFAPLSARNMNKDREDLFNRLKAQGFRFYSYISSNAKNYGTVGDNCFILENNLIQPFTTIEDNVVLWSGNHIGHHSSIGKNTMITSHVVISGNCSVGRNCFFGVNASVKDNTSIADSVFVSMGACVNKNIHEEGAVILGQKTEFSKIKSERIRW
jgi:sugar O-acyltransferase (sialic acid O-acetyltransferase NeuD family)